MFPLVVLSVMASSSIDAALADAQAKHASVLVLVGRSSEEVVPGFIVLHGDATDASLRVLETPAVILFGPDGKEIDRIDGNAASDNATIEETAKDLKARGDVVKNLVARAAATQSPTERARLIVELARKKLVRGDESALSDLERIVAIQTDANAEEALFVMAAYLSRVAHDDSAEHIWRELALRFPQGAHASQAAKEYVAALRAKKRDAVADQFLKRRTP